MSARAAISGALAVAFCLIAAPSAFAAASYVFEPTLSLTGDCQTSLRDEVPDPGLCPIPPGTVFSGSPGADHPSTRFEAPSVAIDSYGDVYVLNMLEAKSRVDVFAPDGTFITEFSDTAGPQSIAVDSVGNVYVFEKLSGGERQVRRFSPNVYQPLKGEIEYGKAPVKIVGNETEPLLLGFGQLQPATSVAVDPATDQLYVDYSQEVARFGSAAEGNPLLEQEAITGLLRSTSIAIDADHKKIYLSDKATATSKSLIRVFELEAPHAEVAKITGSTTPKGEFLSGEGFLQVDVDEATGHVFVGDIVAAAKVYELEESGAYVATIEHEFEGAIGPGGVPGEIAVDNGPNSPRPQKEGWLFVPSTPSPSAGHVYAFEPNEEGPPIVEAASVGDITETEATLHATINPGGLETAYRLEYVSQQQFEAEEGKSFENAKATLAGEGTLPKGATGVEASAPALELEPGTRYRFRAFAENAKGKDEAEKTFTTFPAAEEAGPCENDAFRIGLSALLPDCRAYELVTPGDTNGRPPGGGFAGVYGFPTLRAAPDGNRASFTIEGGLIPGSKGTGSFNGDNYLATRTAAGWATALAGPLGAEAGATKRPSPGSVSPDQAYSLWEDSDGVFIRYPDGHSELVGRGSLGEDAVVNPKLITEGATHIVFQTTDFAHVAQQLEPNAPPAGTTAIYDRSAEGPTHVVSLLPGNEAQKAGENATYLGASEDGEGIAFEVSGTIYLRLHHAETFKVAEPGAKFAGVADEGKRVFYTQAGDLFAFDAAKDETIEFSQSGDVTPVNVASGGTRAYFVSPSVLTGEPNPNGEEAKKGEENLYLSEEGAIGFVGIVTERDVEGENPGGTGRVGGLGLWREAVATGRPAKDPSRTTPAGTTLLFESRADLTGFESKGFAQVYRYDASEGRLTCLSCSPTGTPPASDASLQSVSKEQFSPEPAGSFLKIPNQSPDGKRAFFQSAEPLVLGDSDKKLDVYEWEAKGVGSCETEGGCVYLISGGQSAGPDYLFAMSQSGDDVFFRTSDQLLPRDAEATLSLYDARVGGGFPEAEGEKTPCGAIDTCQPAPPSPPAFPTPGEGTPSEGNVPPSPKPRHCLKGRHAVKRHGKRVCVKNHKKHHRASGSKRKGGSR